jgi:hypothetical protein
MTGDYDMKTFALAAVLAVSFPAAAAAQSAPDHAEHQQHQGQQKPAPAPTGQHPGQNPHQGHGEHHEGMKEECCCKQEQNGGKMACCDKGSGTDAGSAGQHKH